MNTVTVLSALCCCLPAMTSSSDPSERNGQSSTFASEMCGQQDKMGVCYGEVTCNRLEGKPMSFCPGLQGACCVFYRSCGDTAGEEVSHFRNRMWPLSERLGESCALTVKSLGEFCGLSLHINRLRMPGHVGRCSNTFLQVTGVPSRTFDVICGDFYEKTYVLNVTKASVAFIRIKSYSGFVSSWSVTLRKLNCHQFTDEILPQAGDGSLLFLLTTTNTSPLLVTKPSTTATSTTTTTSTTTMSRATTTSTTTTTTTDPYTANERCGIAGPPATTFGTTGGREGFIGSQQVSWAAVNKFSDGLSGGPIITGWSVPQLQETSFYQYKGDKSPVDQRITYGQVAGVSEFPWQAALLTDTSFHCGGSLISDFFVLTAAHCVASYGNTPSHLKVVLGDWDLSTDADGNAQVFGISAIRVHEQYSKYTLQNDIAVLKLSARVAFTDTIRTVCLPTQDLELEGRLATITGWGRDETGRLVFRLHKLSAMVVSNVLCDQRWRKNGAQKGFIAPSMMCMDAQDGDSCNGDSGGPSVVEHPEGSGIYVQAGIVSFGSGSCTEARLPGVYTRVSFFRDWIRRQMY